MKTQTGKTYTSRDYSDGSRSASSRENDVKNPKQPTPRIDVRKAFAHEDQIGSTARPDPLRYFYVGKEPLFEALLNAKYLGDVRKGDVSQAVFAFDGVLWSKRRQNLVYYMDRSNVLE